MAGKMQRDLNRMSGAAHKHRLGDLILAGVGGFGFTRGGYWFVDAANGNDNNSGESLSNPVQTIQRALYNITQKRTAAGLTYDYDEYIFLLPTQGVDYDDDTVSNTSIGGLANAYVYVNEPNIHIIGAGPLGSVIIKPDAAATAGVFNIGTSGERFHLSNVVINTASALSAAVKFGATGGVFPVIENCIFDLVGTTGPTGVGIDMDSGKCSSPIIRNNVFYMGTLIKAAIIAEVQDATPFGGLIEDNRFISVINGAGTGVADVINVKDGTGLIINNNVIHGGDTGTTYNATDGVDIDSGVVNAIISNCCISGCDNPIIDGGTDCDIVNNFTADGEGGEAADYEGWLFASS